MRLLLVRSNQSDKLMTLESHVGLRRVILSRCDSTGHPRGRTESIGVGYTGRKARADQLQPTEQLLH